MFSQRLIRSLLAIVALFVACTAVQASKYPLTIKDYRGRTIVIPHEPRRIVSTVPSNTEILFALGLDSHIVGVGSWDNYPAKAKMKTTVGDRNTSVEKVISLKPDLVLAHGKLNVEMIPTLEKYGIKVLAIDPQTIEEVQRDILLVGRVTNREKQASSVSSKISAAAAFVKKKTAGIKSHPKVLFAVQSEPLWVAGTHTFIDEMIRFSGGVNVASSAKPGFSQFSTEAAVFQQPDIIIGTEKDTKQVFTRGMWKNTKASRAGRIFEANPDPLVRAGPRLAIGIISLAKLIHPEAFK